jgi:hypothetical protein
VTGTVTLGGGGAATTVAQVKDAGGTVVCWMGQYVVSSVTYYGIWASNVWIGGSGPAAAKIWLDTYGNAHFSGAVESGSTITAPSISGGSLSITTSNGVVSITPGGVGVNVASGSYYSSISPGSVLVTSGTQTSSLNVASLVITGATVVDSSMKWVGYGVNCPSYNVTCYSATIGAGGCTVGGYAVLTSYSPSTAVTFSSVAASGGYSGGAFTGNGTNHASYGVTCYSVSAGAGGIYTSGTYTGGQFQGAGVSCTSYGVSCYSLTVGAGGLSVNGYSGSTHQLAFYDSGGGYCKISVDGGTPAATRMDIHYGLYYQQI